MAEKIIRRRLSTCISGRFSLLSITVVGALFIIHSAGGENYRYFPSKAYRLYPREHGREAGLKDNAPTPQGSGDEAAVDPARIHE